MRPVAVVSSGMRTAVGLSSPSSCAAIRCAIGGAAETGFMDSGGEWLMGCSVPVEGELRGLEKLAAMAAAALSECLVAALPAKLKDVPVAFCVAEKGRPGRFQGLDERLPAAVQASLKKTLHPKSCVIAHGRTGAAHALVWAERLLSADEAPFCAVVGVDTLLVGDSLRVLEQRGRLLTSVNSNGFIPGDAAAAVLVARGGKSKGMQLTCDGIGFGTEKATVESEEPLRGDGLVEAVRSALAAVPCTFEQVQYRLVDASGEQYGLKEAQLAIGRSIRGTLKPEFPIWHPADCIGEVGAAIGPCLLGLALEASRKGYAPGPGALCHLGTDDGDRAALILKYGETKA